VIFDFCVIGGGIVGMATARELVKRCPGASLVVLEKETDLGCHQTGHNSGVIHSGVYYEPGSLKAQLCRRGAVATKAFCAEHAIPFEVPGKLVVATGPVEVARMEALLERSQQNRVEVDRLGADELTAREPNVHGLGALFFPTTGITDFRRICHAMADDVRSAGGQVELGVAVTRIVERVSEVTVAAGERRWSARRLVVCAGLQADRLAMMAGLRIGYRIVPFRGEYYRLPASKNDIVHRLIYPIPNPDLPFLGVHVTRMIDGGVTVGPNAVLGLAREGYGRFSLSARDVREYAAFPGLWRLARANLRTGLREVRNSVWKAGYLEECRKYCPSLTVADLLPEEAGIRAQAVMRDGTLVHDFLVVETDRMLHVGNAPSPAATSAIPIGEMIADRCLRDRG
jgi:(S)-2-hydroxyglutarate dehydrogenase